MPIRVAIADDHPLMRGGLAAVIATAPDLVLVGEARDGREAVEMFRALRPDVLPVDLAIPELSGIDAIRAVMDDQARATARSHGSASDEDAPAPRVIVLTVYAGDDDIRRALAVGAAGYLLKDAAGADVIGAIRAVTRGELEVLTLIAAGCRNREIAERIGRTEETVKMHVKSVLAKLGARDRTGAVNAALKRGFLHIP